MLFDDISYLKFLMTFLQDKDALSALKDGMSMSFLLPYGIEIAKSCR